MARDGHHRCDRNIELCVIAIARAIVIDVVMIAMILATTMLVVTIATMVCRDRARLAIAIVSQRRCRILIISLTFFITRSIRIRHQFTCRTPTWHETYGRKAASRDTEGE